MAEFNLFLGGERTNNAGFTAYPQGDTTRLLDYAQHKKANLFELDRRLDFRLGDTAIGENRDCALQQWACGKSFQVNDIIWTHRLEPASTLLGFGWLVEAPLAGATAEIVLSAVTGSAITVLDDATDIDLAVGYPAGAERFNLDPSCPDTFPADETCNGAPMGEPPVYTNWGRGWLVPGGGSALTAPLNITGRRFMGIRLTALAAPGVGALDGLCLNVHANIWGFNKARGL